MKGLKEKIFFLDNDREVNRLVLKIGGIFMVVLIGILAAAYFDLFKVEPFTVLYTMGLLLLTETVLFILIKCKVSETVVKYVGLLTLEACIVTMVANAYFGIYISHMLIPVISCLYFDKKFTARIIVICYFGMLIGLWFRAPGIITLAYPGYTRMSWFIAFAVGYSLEYIALSAVVLTIAKRSRRNLEALYHRNEKITEIQDKIIYRFADLVESRDDETGKHVKRTSRYVVAIAEKLRENSPYSSQISKDELEFLELAAPLHDIGKIVIPDSILLKPGRLTPGEFEIIKTHTTEGVKIVISTLEEIEREEFVTIAKQITLSHHEKWDGTGYPDGLTGLEIPLPARIMAVADVFDALVNNRCYKPAITCEDAIGILIEGKGKHFDPVIVDAFIAAKDRIMSIQNDISST